MNRYLKLLIGFFLVIGCYLSAEGQRFSDQDFKAIFNEATKNFLFGKYVQSVNLYKECLRINPRSSATHFQLSKVYLSAGNVPLAREHAKHAVELEENNKWYLQTLGDVYQMEEKTDSAVIYYEKLLALDSDNINIMFGIANLYERLQKHNKALELLKQIDSRIGISKEVSMARYRIYESIGDSDQAINELKAVELVSPDDYMVSGLIAEYYQRHNVQDSAEYYYRKIFPEYRSDPNVVFSYSSFLLESGKIDTARILLLEIMNDTTIDHSVKAGYFFNILRDDADLREYGNVLDTITRVFIRGYENDVRSLAIYADVFFRLKKYSDASWALTEIARRDPSNYPVLEQLIYIENILGNSEDVIQYALKAKRLQPQKPFLYLLSGSAYYQMKDYSKALSELNTGLSLTDDKTLMMEFYSLMAECYQQTSQFAESEKSFKAALSIDKSNLGIKNNYAYYLSLREKNLSYARRLSKATIKAEPENATYLDTYGWVLFKMGKVKKAERFILDAISKGSSANSEVLSHYADILIKQGRYAEAVRYLERILTLNDKEEILKAKERINKLNIQMNGSKR